MLRFLKFLYKTKHNVINGNLIYECNHPLYSKRVELMSERSMAFNDKWDATDVTLQTTNNIISSASQLSSSKWKCVLAIIGDTSKQRQPEIKSWKRLKIERSFELYILQKCQQLDKLTFIFRRGDWTRKKSLDKCNTM